jgi:hypothetical protein
MFTKLLAAVLLFLCLSAGTQLASSGSFEPGVSVGDYFTYQMYGVFVSNISNTTMQIPQFEYNNTQWVKITIANVDGSKINQLYTLHFQNQSETSVYILADTEPTSENKPTGQAVPICAANQTVGDKIPTAGVSITDSGMRQYGSGQRETNHALWNATDDWGEGYFDRGTGMMVDFVRTHRFVNQNTGEIVEKTDHIRLIETNKWQVSSSTKTPLPLWLILASLFLLLVSLGAIHGFLRKKKLSRHFGMANY